MIEPPLYLKQFIEAKRKKSPLRLEQSDAFAISTYTIPYLWPSCF